MRTSPQIWTVQPGFQTDVKVGCVFPMIVFSILRIRNSGQLCIGKSFKAPFSQHPFENQTKILKIVFQSCQGTAVSIFVIPFMSQTSTFLVVPWNVLISNLMKGNNLYTVTVIELLFKYKI